MSSPTRWRGLAAAAQAVQPALAGRPGKPRGPLGADAHPVARPEPAATRPAACQPDLGRRSRWTSARPRPSVTPRPRSATAYGIDNVTFGIDHRRWHGPDHRDRQRLRRSRLRRQHRPELQHQRPGRVRPGIRPARPAELHQVQRDRPDDQPARHRPGRRRQPQRQLGDGGGARHRVGARHRPRRPASTWSRRATTPTTPTCSPAVPPPPACPACRSSR